MNELASNYTIGLPVAASTYADKIDFSLFVLHVGMIVFFVLWLIFFAYCLFRFRRGKNPTAESDVDKWAVRSYLPDGAILIFELVLIFALGLPVWNQVKEEFPRPDRSFVVELVAEQFAWNFQYAGADRKFGRKDPAKISAGNTIGLDLSDPASQDDIVSLNELHVPLGKPTIIYMTSKDVIHSFFVPEFRIKQDIVPGMKIPIWFEPNRLGTFELVCSQLCGLGHYRMKGRVIVQEPDDLERTLKNLKAEQEEI